MKYKIPTLTTLYFKLPFIGEGNYEVQYVASLDAADDQSVVFFSGANEEILCSISAGIVIADKSLLSKTIDPKARAVVFSSNPKLTFLELLRTFFTDSFEHHNEVDERGADSKISPSSTVESGAIIGEGTEIFPNVFIAGNVRLGKKCIVRASSALGCSGLGDLWYDGKYNRFVHVGGVVIGDDVTIGTNVSIARGMLEDTIIGSGTRIANNVNIGHSVIIGKNCYISSGVTIGGACVIEDGAWLSVGCVLTDHVTIGNRAMVGAGAVILKDALPNTFYLGNPARAVSERRHP